MDINNPGQYPNQGQGTYAGQRNPDGTYTDRGTPTDRGTRNADGTYTKKDTRPPVRVLALAKGHDGLVVREAGDEFNMPARAFDLVLAIGNDGKPEVDRDGLQSGRMVQPDHPWFIPVDSRGSNERAAARTAAVDARTAATAAEKKATASPKDAKLVQAAADAVQAAEEAERVADAADRRATDDDERIANARAQAARDERQRRDEVLPRQ